MWVACIQLNVDEGVPGVERMQSGVVNWRMFVAGVIQCPGR